MRKRFTITGSSDPQNHYLEREGRPLFLTFLKPVINGTGFYYVEPQTRNNSRMDLVVTYGRKEFVVELKIWYGEKYEERGRDQLAGYLAARGLEEGYLVTFDFSKRTEQKRTRSEPSEPQWMSPLEKVQTCRNLSKNQCVAAPLPCRGGAGVGLVSYSLSGYYRPHPAQRAPLPYKGGEGLARQFEDYIDFLKWTHGWSMTGKGYLK